MNLSDEVRCPVCEEDAQHFKTFKKSDLNDSYDYFKCIKCNYIYEHERSEKNKKCPSCNGEANFFGYFDDYHPKQDYDYYQCTSCNTIFIDRETLAACDAGEELVSYDNGYWDSEYCDAKQRCFGSALARMAEAMYYVRIPVDNFLDIGTGTGLFLDAVQAYLPNSSNRFYGIEKFPPERQAAHTNSPNYYVGGYDKLPCKFQCGICIEMIEHMTPSMFKGLLEDIKSVSDKGALYVFNTGMIQFVQEEYPLYLDPYRRGHIISWSIEGVRILAEPLGFAVHELPGKSWAFVLEYGCEPTKENIKDRIWTALPENLSILEDEKMGSVLSLLGIESARAYG